MQVYSNAFNFSSFLNGDVDPRTGLYGSKINLLTITPEGPSENTREIALSFSMLNQTPSQYGLGWSITSAQFDRTTDQLRSLNGEVNHISSFPSVGNILQFRDRKLHDMFVRQPTAEILHIMHKDGVMEVLRPLVNNGPFVIRELIFENGERFDFRYDNSDRLITIGNSGSGRTLLTLAYNTSNFLSSATVLKDGGRAGRIEFTYTNGELTTVAIQAGNSSVASFTFEYISLGTIRAIHRFRDPNGRLDTVTYRSGSAGHQYHAGQFIPNVQSVTTDATPSPGITKSYLYSVSSNFTGFPIRDFISGQDSIYAQASNYEYWTQVTTLDDSTSEQKTYTFNRFHLKIREQTNRSNSNVDQTLQYNLLTTESFDRQPANLHLPREIRTTYRSSAGTRFEERTMETDRFGNSWLLKDPNGITRQFDYFPVGGGSGCPPEPFGLFERFVREERVTPASGGGTTKVTTYTYVDMRNFDNTRGFVLPLRVTQGSVSHTYTYQTDANVVALHGRVSQSAMTLSGSTAATTTTHTYSIDGDVLIGERRLTGLDHAFLTLSRSTSVINGLMLSLRNNDSVSLQFTYDLLGRPLTETISPGTPNASTRQYAYVFAGSGARSEVRTTDALDVTYIRRFDGLNRHISTHRVQSPSNQLLLEKTYNRFGQLTSHTEVDHMLGRDLRQQTRYAYDGWGQVSETTRPDGSVAVSRYDPISRVREDGVNGAVITRSYMNEFDKAYYVELTGGGSALKAYSRTFDGFGRCIAEEDVNGHVKRFSYDAYDRLVTETFAPARSGVTRTIENAYAKHTVEEFKTSIKVNQIVVGSRSYDGVGRLLSESRGSNGATTTFSYVNNMIDPSSTRSPSGVEKFFQYDTQLEGIRQVTSNGQSVATFDFNPKTGGLKSAINSEFRRDVQEDNFGRIATDSQTFQGNTRTNAYTYSPAGRLTSMQTALGDTETRAFDDAGRFAGATLSGGQTGASQLGVGYDGAGRISTFYTMVNNVMSHVTLSYDQFGRESERRMTRGGAAFQSIKLSYHNTSKIATRQLLNASQAQICAETFGYDAIGHLTTYTCSGPQYPTDLQGRAIRAQEFTYDVLDNITKCVTVFADSTRDESIRSFDVADRTQLRQVTHTNPPRTITLSYDASGNLTSDGVKVYHFNVLNQLSSVTQGGNALSSYGYDATGRQGRIAGAGNDSATIHYSEDHVIGLRQGNMTARYIRNQKTVLARSISGIGTEVNVSDVADSVRTVIDANQQLRQVHYTPYGESTIDTGSGTLLERSRPGFNGERYDPLATVYHLGNGHRAYSPELMIFLSPDPLSSFGPGGINAYAYCLGDPINFRDPSGHFRIPMWASWVMLAAAAAILVYATAGIALPLVGAIAAGAVAAFPTVGLIALGTGAVSLVLSTAALSLGQFDAIAATDHSTAIWILNVASLVTGAVAFGFGVPSMISLARTTFRLAMNIDDWSASYFRISIPTLMSISREATTAFVPHAQMIRSWFFVIDTLVQFAAVSADAWTIYSGLRGVVADYPYYPDSNQFGSGLYGPVVDTLSGPLKNAKSFTRDFQKFSRILRGSAMLDG